MFGWITEEKKSESSSSKNRSRHLSRASSGKSKGREEEPVATSSQTKVSSHSRETTDETLLEPKKDVPPVASQQSKPQEPSRRPSLKKVPHTESKKDIPPVASQQSKSEEPPRRPSLHTVPPTITKESTTTPKQTSANATDVSIKSPTSAPSTAMVGTATTSSTTSWKEALYRTCQAKSTFIQTPTQVLQEQPQQALRRPRLIDGSIILYQQDNVQATAKAVAEQLCNRSLAASNNGGSSNTSSLSRRLVNSVAWGANSVIWAASKVVELLVGEDDDDYKEEELTYREEGDDADLAATGPELSWDVPVVCVDFVESIVQQLLSHSDNTNNNTVALSRRGTGEHSFAGWVASACPCLGKNIKVADLDLLANVMTYAGHAVVYQDFLVFNSSATEADLQVAASLVQLKQAMYDTDKRIREWEEQVEKYRSVAVLKKKNGDQKGALHALHKAKLLEHKVESARSSLLNLQQAHDTLETSSLQHKQVIKPLEAAASALKGLRQEYPVEKVDDIVLNLQEELEEAAMMPSESLFVGLQDFDDIGEDKILEELNNLTLEDDDYDDGNKRDRNEKIGISSPVDIDLPSVPTTKPSAKRDVVKTPPSSL